MNFWKQYRILCAERGISYSKAAEDMGYSRSMTTSWSNGSTPKPSTVKRCAEYFGVSVDVFYGEEPKPQPARQVVAEYDVSVLNEQGQKLLKEFYQFLVLKYGK